MVIDMTTSFKVVDDSAIKKLYAKISAKMGGRCPVNTDLLKNGISYAVKENSGSTKPAALG